MAQKVNPVAVRLNFNRFSDSSWFSDYYYSTLLYQDFNFRQYLSSIKLPSANKLGFRQAKCIIHHFPKRSLIHLFCLSDPRRKNLFPTTQNRFAPSMAVVKTKGATIGAGVSLTKKLLEEQIKREGQSHRLSDPNKSPLKAIKTPQPIEHSSSEYKQLREASITGGTYDRNLILDSWRLTALKQKDNQIVDKNINTSRHEVMTFSSKNVLIRTRWRSASLLWSYWLKSSTLHKKRALVNLHRSIVENFSQSFTLPRDRCLVSGYAAGLYKNTVGPSVTWYRKTRAKKSHRILRHVGDYQAGILLSAFPQSLALAPSFAKATSKMVHSMTSFVVKPTKLTPVVVPTVVPELAKNFTRRHTINTAEAYIPALSAKGLLGRLNPSKPFPHSFSSGLSSNINTTLFSERREDPSIKLEKRESILMTLHDSILRWRYFNFYAMNYFFIQKMGDHNNRLPFRLNGSLHLLSPSLQQKESSSHDHLLKARCDSEKASWFRHSVFPTNISGSHLDVSEGHPLERRNLFGSSSNNRIAKSADFYLSNVHSILSQTTNTFISLRPIKVHSVFQCASLVAQEVACKLEQKKSFRIICRLIFQQLAICTYIKGIRITCSGRLNGAEIAKTECRKFGETSLHVFSDKIDYARAEASTPYGILGIKVWISYI